MSRSANRKKLHRTFYRLACVTVLALGLTASILTLAYFTSNDEVTNRVSAADIEIALLEPNWELSGREDARSVQPGMIIAKDPQVLNKSDNAVYVRMRILSNDKPVSTDNNAWILKAIDIKYSDFMQNEDGWYYYGKSDSLTPLDPQQTTAKLFTRVEIPVKKADYANFANGFNITIEAQVISVVSVDGTDTEAFVAEFNNRYSLDGGTVTT